MRDCEEYRELISCLIDGELKSDDEAALLAHIASCDECREIYEAYRDIAATLSGDMAEPPDAMAEGVMFRIRGEHANRKKRAKRLTFYAAAAACFVLVFVGAGASGLLWGGGMGKSAAAAPRAAEPAMFAAADAATAEAAGGEDAVYYNAAAPKEEAEIELAESDVEPVIAEEPAAEAAPAPEPPAEPASEPEAPAPDSAAPPSNEAGKVNDVCLGMASPMGVITNALVYDAPEGYTVYGSLEDFNEGAPIATFTEPEELLLLEELLSPADKPPKPAVPQGDARYIIELENEAGDICVIEVWIDGDTLICRSESDGTPYYAAGTLAELKELLGEETE